MGDVFVKVKLRGMRADGRPSAKAPSAFDALVDTGSSKTVVSAAVARAVGIRPMAVRGHLSGAGGIVEVRLGRALALVTGCEAEPLLVGISDAITERAGVAVVLGHDYMQAVRMAVRPHERSARCEGESRVENPARRPKATAARGRRRA